MAYQLSSGEIAFIQRHSSHEEVTGVSHLLNALVTGVDITPKDLLAIEDYLMDRASEIADEDLDVPPFFDSIRGIVTRLLNSAPIPNSTAPQSFNQAQPAPKKERKVRESKPVSDEPKISKKERYKDAEITPDNIPAYLLDIHNIINQVVEARCQEEISRRIVAEEKLEKLQTILRGM